MAGREVWTDTRLRAAWAAGDWGLVLREYRRAARITQVELENLVGLPQPHISAIENGRRRVTTAELQTRITEGLQVPPELTGATDHTFSEWAPPSELRARIEHAFATGRADLRTADRLANVLAHHRRSEDEGGGVDLWPVVRSQLDAVTRILPDTSGAAADRLLLLAAEHAHWLSWVAWTEQQHGDALAWLDTAHGWAIDGGHQDMGSWVLRVRSYYQLAHGDPRRALRTAEAARETSGTTPAARGVAAHQAAMAAAALGDRGRARELRDEALMLALQVPDEEERPGWLYWLDPARAHAQAAEASYACRECGDAVAGLRKALPGLAAYPRDHDYYAAKLTDAERRA